MTHALSRGDVLRIARPGHNLIMVELTEDQASPMAVYGRRLHWQTGRPIGNGEARLYLVDGDRQVIKITNPFPARGY